MVEALSSPVSLIVALGGLLVAAGAARLADAKGRNEGPFLLAGAAGLLALVAGFGALAGPPESAWAFGGSFRIGFAPDALAGLVIVVAALLGVATSLLEGSAARGRAALVVIGTSLAALASTPLAFLLVLGLQGRALAAGGGASRREARGLQAAADLLAGLGVAALLAADRGGSFALSLDGGPWPFAGVAGAALGLSAALRIGAPPAAAATAALYRGDPARRLVESLTGPGFLAVLLCARSHLLFGARPGVAITLVFLAFAATAAGLGQAFLATGRSRALAGLTSAGQASALLLIGLGAPVLAVTVLLSQVLALAPLYLAAGLLRRQAGGDRLDRGAAQWRRYPLLGVATGLAAASLVGVPPLLGFTAAVAARWRAISAGPGHGWLLWLGVVALGVAHAVVVTRWWLASFFGDGEPGLPRVGTGLRRGLALAGAGLLLTAGFATAPRWTGFADVTGALIATCLGEDQSDARVAVSGEGSSAAGIAFGLLGAMATLAGVYLGARLAHRRAEWAPHLAVWSERDPARIGPRFLRRRVARPVERIAETWAEPVVEQAWGRGLRRRFVSAVSAAGRRVAAFQNGDVSFYGAIAMVALLLILLSWAR